MGGSVCGEKRGFLGRESSRLVQGFGCHVIVHCTAAATACSGNANQPAGSDEVIPHMTLAPRDCGARATSKAAARKGRGNNVAFWNTDLQTRDFSFLCQTPCSKFWCAGHSFRRFVSACWAAWPPLSIPESRVSLMPGSCRQRIP